MATNEGTTANGVVTAQDTADAQAKAELVTSQKEAIALDKAIDRDIKKISDTFDALALKLAQAKRADTWRLVMNTETGKPFTSFAKYLESKQELMPKDLGVATRKKLVAEMVAYGMSISEMQAVTGASRGTTSADAAAARGEAKEDNGGPGTRKSEPTPEQAAAKALKALELALAKVNDALENMTVEQLDSVVLAGTAIAKQAKGLRIIAAKLAGASEPTPVTPAKAAPAKAAPAKVTPATVAANAGKVAVPA